MKNLLLGFLSFILATAHLLAAHESPSTQVNFEENRGQWPSSVRYVSSTSHYRVALTSDGLRLSAMTVPEEIAIRWIGSNSDAEISAGNRLPYDSSYFLGNDPVGWKTAVPFFDQVFYRNIYPGISVVYHCRGNEIEQDIHVEPGADINRFRFEVQGANEISVDGSGRLVLKARQGTFSFGAPKIYQLSKDGKEIPVAGRYVVRDSFVSFRLRHYDRAAGLIIDPVLSYSTYLRVANPNARLDQHGFLSVDSSGAACVTDGKSLYGYDANGNVTFTVPDIFSVAPNLGAMAIFRDAQGNCYVAGETPVHTSPSGTTFGFPVAGVAKFSSTGTLLHFAFFGGNPNAITPSRPAGLTADSTGNVYVVGQTTAADFPTKNPIQNLLQGSSGTFVLQLDSTFSSLIYSTFFGTSTEGNAIALDAAGAAYITGDFTAAGGSVPTTNGAFQTAFKTPSSNPSFVSKISSSGALVYSTYLGGSTSEVGNAIAVDSSGSAYVAGATASADFPTKNAFQSSLTGSADGFVSKLTPDGSGLVYSTFLGGTVSARINAIAVDGNGAAYVTGLTNDANFPLLHPLQSERLTTFGNDTEVFVTAFDNTGSALQYSTLFGGPDSDNSTSIGVDAGHNVYIAGTIESFSTNPPPQFHSGFLLINADNGLFQPFSPLCPMFGCVGAGFIAKISPNSGTALASPSAVDFATVPKGQSGKVVPILIFNVGSTDLMVNNTSITGDYTISNNTCAGALLSAKHCEVDSVFSPTGGGTRTGVLTLTSNAPDSPRNIQLTGIGGVPVVSLNPTSLGLTSPAIGTAGPPKTIVLSNTGANTLNITSLSIIGTNAADLSETHDCTSTLGAGLSCNVNLTYKPSTSNTESATLQFVDDAAGSPHTVPLTGTVSAFGLALAPGGSSSTTISAGQMATYNLMIGGPGFSGNVTLSCIGAPPAASCSVPGSESLSSTPATFQATVMTTARSTAVKLPSSRDFPSVPVVAVFVLGLSGLVLLASKRRRMVIALACVSLAVVLMASCGGGGSGGGSNGTPAGTFTIVVTATNGSSSQSMNLTLNVN